MRNSALYLALTIVPGVMAYSSCSRMEPHGLLGAGGAGGGSDTPDTSVGSGGGGASSAEAGGGSTGGAGGASAVTSSSSSSSASSTGSGPPECLTAADCPGVDTECSARVCDGGKCGVQYPDNVPIGAQITGDCAVTVCDGSGGTKQLYDSADATQTPGDCSTTVCLGIGQTTQQSTNADVPPSTECSTGVCSPTGPAQQPIADGTTCSTGLCKGGACGKYIQVCCATNGNGAYCGCDGNPNPLPYDIQWTDETGGMHYCDGLDSTHADYCKPGTACRVSAFGNLYLGTCK